MFAWPWKPVSYSCQSWSKKVTASRLPLIVESSLIGKSTVKSPNLRFRGGSFPLFKIKLMDFATIMAILAMAVLESTHPGHEILLFGRIEVTEKYAWDCTPCWLVVYGLPTISCVSHIVWVRGVEWRREGRRGSTSIDCCCGWRIKCRLWRQWGR